MAILTLIGFKCGEKEEEGLVIPSGTLRNYCIQVFQQPTHKMQKMMQVLVSLGHMKIEDLGEGRQKVTILNHAKLSGFVDWYNKYLFTEEAKRVTILEKELKTVYALIFYGKKTGANEKGEVTVSLTEIQNDSMKDLHYLVNVADSDSLGEKGIIGEKQQAEGADGAISSTFNLTELDDLYPYWQIVYALTTIPAQ